MGFKSLSFCQWIYMQWSSVLYHKKPFPQNICRNVETEAALKVIQIVILSLGHFAHRFHLWYPFFKIHRSVPQHVEQSRRQSVHTCSPALVASPEGLRVTPFSTGTEYKSFDTNPLGQGQSHLAAALFNNCVFSVPLLCRSFNMPHDDNPKCMEAGLKNQYRVMAPVLNYETSPWTWSKCSRKYITEFLE